MDLEQHVEGHLVKRVRALGGFSFKFDAIPGHTGLPDRLVILPGRKQFEGHTPKARIIFVELKRPVGGRFSAKQMLWRSVLTQIGCEVFWCRTKQEVEDALGD